MAAPGSCEFGVDCFHPGNLTTNLPPYLMTEIPPGGAPEPLTLLPKGGKMSFVTSHFALPVRNEGNATGLTMGLVDALTTYGQFAKNVDLLRGSKNLDVETADDKKEKKRHSVNLMENLMVHPPTLAEFDGAMRLLNGTAHYKTAKALALKARNNMKLHGATLLRASHDHASHSAHIDA